MTFHEALIPIAAVLVAISIPFIMRGLQKGEGQTITTTNVYNLKGDLSNLEKRQAESCADTKRRFDKIYDTLNEIGADIKLHTNQLANLQIDITKIEDRLRKAEGDIIRISRNGT